MAIDLENARRRLQDFEFLKLFIEELGWSQPADCRPVAMGCGDTGPSPSPGAAAIPSATCSGGSRNTYQGMIVSR